MIQWSTNRWEAVHEKNSVLTMFIVAALLATCAWGINGTATSSGDGFSDNDHKAQLPAKVVQLSKSAYLLQDSSVQATDICGGYSTSDGGDIGQAGPVDTVAHPQAIKPMVYVSCDESQHWNVNKPVKPSLGRALVLTFYTLAWAIPTGGVLLLILLYAGLMTYGVGHNARKRDKKKRKAEAKAAKQKMPTLEQKRIELVQAYSRDEINDLEFEQGLNKLYALGLPKPKA